MNKYSEINIGQKVRCALSRSFAIKEFGLFILGVALFYAWNLYTIYCRSTWEPIEPGAISYMATVAPGATATVGFICIALGLYKLKHFDLVGLAVAVIAGGAFLALPSVGDALGIGQGAIWLIQDAASRAASCWVIVAWGSQYARLSSKAITTLALGSFLAAIVFCCILMRCPSWLCNLFLASALPISMGIQLRASELPDSLFDKGGASPHHGFWGLTWRVVLVFFLFGLVTWVNIIYGRDGSWASQSTNEMMLVGTAVVVGVLFAFSIAARGSFTNSYIYRIVLPSSMFGVLLVGGSGFAPSIGSALIRTSYTCFDLFCFILFADACGKTGANARSVFGWCRAIESSTPIFAALVCELLVALGFGGDPVVSLIGPASILVVVAVLMLDRTSVFDRGQLNPDILYPRAEVLLFARQCEYAISLYSLSQREAEVLSLIVRGRSVPHIAQRLMLSKSTVRTHISHIYEKFGVNERQEMIDAIEMIRPDDLDNSEAKQCGGQTHGN